ncbi:hypothetical protein [Phyllobacterium brassicacearum]|uniref:hypothetical protein n=1 Tax=Phyllobacterium brassicacearum TaxID=314235 RepID=UPI0010E1CE23|nr:hypothetical protein [Phyllobacterium brassicacearum]TDQ31673.1 hypothetical protein DEV91_1077 [Phyllobacterium brassicacearum]
MKVSDGLGLGLSIVERIAKILELSISVNSAIGKGSVFSVSMPISNSPPIQAFEEQRKTKPGNVLAGLLIICVDDNEQSLAGVQELLTTWGCKVIAFNNGNA